MLRETFFLHLGGGGEGGGREERFSNFGNNQFLGGEIAGKTLSVRQNFIGNIHLSQKKSFKLGQVWHRYRQQDS